jgi:hypothetical protein
MPIDRRHFLKAVTTTTAAMSGIYLQVDKLSRPFERATNRRLVLPLEQHLFSELETVADNNVRVLVPPLHHMVVTASLRTGWSAKRLRAAQVLLERTLSKFEDDQLLTFTPAGLGLAVAWGLPYFRHLEPSLVAKHMPIDLHESRALRHSTPAVVDTIRFPSDPVGLVLEQNDVAIVMASDNLDHIDVAFDALFHGATKECFELLSIRQGFVDARSVGTNKQSLTKQLALQAGIPGASSIPDSAELFLGFTSTQVDALGPGTIANFESLPGFTNQWPRGYFVGGTAMHLSHVYEDLVAWYGESYGARVGATYSPRAENTVNAGIQTIPAGPTTVENFADLRQDLQNSGFIGHSTSMQPISRLHTEVTDHRGVRYSAGTSIPQRADFNTLDSPFAFSAQPQRDGELLRHSAGIHFVSYTPTSSMFAALRMAMDGNYQSTLGTTLGTTAVGGPFNTVLTPTHRQNFLVPPRKHRSFPLAELL